ncbi:MAG: 23S rRNA (guanosine(2251)-2'-O)-methyltransferase RlmB [Gammaproteobacteria bacterium]|nr:23S rRNA (guanosine(2251)-2'-O)-methyltransferase RlmB [Gammaproteobacteria bacterium]
MPRTDETIYGVHAVRHALKGSLEWALELWVQQGERVSGVMELVHLAEANGLPVHRVPRKTLDRLTDHGRHQGVVLRRKRARVRGDADLMRLLDNLSQRPLLLVLDGVLDPHNLGACLRTADAAGVDGVVIPRDRASGLTAAVHKVASGAADSVALVQVSNLARALRRLQEAGLWLVGATVDAAENLYDADLTLPLALVLGAEGRGLRRLTREHCDLLVHLPMHGTVESLNVAVASGVCLFEALRQRRAQSAKLQDNGP